MKIKELIEKYDNLVKSAFIPNPAAMQQEQQLQQLMAQLQQVLSTQPPQVQQQVQGVIEQLSMLPPEQQIAQLSGVVSQLSQPEQAAPQAEQTNATPPAQPGVAAENNLDETKVTLSVRELLDLSSGGKATQSLLKVKQMAEMHNKKMEAAQEQQAAQQEQAAQQAQQTPMSQAGGIYPQPQM